MEQEQGRPLFTLNGVQVFPAATKQNLTEANYTAWVLEAENRGKLILVRHFPKVWKVASVPCIM